jgi:putative SOS response-associated peptidase YedK
MLHWGLIPSWATDPKIGNRMIIARSEEAAGKPSFRSAMRHRRWLIPADGFFEWKKVGKAKQPYYFTLASNEPFAFAGLWERWSKGGEPIQSCTILTTSANELVKPYHDRMPVSLSTGDYDA